MEKYIKLSNASVNEVCVIRKVEIEDELKHKRLCELGFCSGLKIKVLKKTKKLMLVGALGCCFSVDRDITDKILVFGGGKE